MQDLNIMGLKIMCDDGIDLSPRNLTPEEYEQQKADSYNALVGNLNEIDGYDCPLCRNKGSIMRIELSERGMYYEIAYECKCMKNRRAIRRLKASGLEKFVKDCSFAKFRADEPWQKVLKTAAEEYAKNPKGWFFIGGQSGAGKTHLCTAICRQFLLEGKAVVYMPWRTESVKLKASVNDSEVYESLIKPIKSADVLYIDDLFKTANDGSGQKPTTGDINLAFDILNYRYVNNLLTVISSESISSEILEFDEAIGGRIIEKARPNFFDIGKDVRKNFRTKGVTKL